VTDQPDLTEVIGDAILDYYDGFGQHPGVTRAYGAAEAVVAALGRRMPHLRALLDGEAVQEWTWRHNRYVGVAIAYWDGVITDPQAAEHGAAACRKANPGHDVGVVTRFVTPWVEVERDGSHG
jgi:hypothetical protein